jgi:hypothetical protein
MYVAEIIRSYFIGETNGEYESSFQALKEIKNSLLSSLGIANTSLLYDDILAEM